MVIALTETTGPIRRIAAVLVNGLSFVLATIISVALLMQFATIFFLVTLGPETIGGPTIAMARYHPGPIRLGGPAALIVGGMLLISAVRGKHPGAWSYQTALLPVPVVGILAFMTLSYRLVGLLACCVAVWAYVHYVRGQGKLRILTYACVVMMVAATLPFDISLQNVPGPPRFVPSTAGLPTTSEAKAAERGEVIIVGACVPMYNEPTWVWVW